MLDQGDALGYDLPNCGALSPYSTPPFSPASSGIINLDTLDPLGGNTKRHLENLNFAQSSYCPTPRLGLLVAA
jgi:hypothetical protein